MIRRNKYTLTNFKLVGNFMNRFGQEVIDKESPNLGTQELQDLRVDLIQEELKELQEALAEKDLIEVADALTDILYVTYGAGHAFGIDLDDWESLDLTAHKILAFHKFKTWYKENV